MRFGSVTSRSNPISAVDLTAMIDVVFLLVVFFMVTATFAHRWPEAVLLPDEVGTPREVEVHDLVLHLDNHGVLRVGEHTRPFETSAIVSLLGSTPELGRVLIRVDRRCQAALLDPVLDTLRDAGVAHVDMAVSSERSR